MRSKRMRKYKKQFRHVILVGKMVFIWYLILFAVSFVTTSNTTAEFTDLKEVSSMIYAAGDWQVVDESSFKFAEKDKPEINTCEPKIIKALVKNDGTGDMHDTSTYDVYFSENGDPRTDGIKMKLAKDEGTIPELEKGKSIELTFKATKPGNYLFVAYQMDENRTEIWSDEIVITCESEQKQDTEKTSDNASESANEKNAPEEKSDTVTEDNNEDDAASSKSNDDRNKDANSSTDDDANDSDKKNSENNEDNKSNKNSSLDDSSINEDDSTNSTDKKEKDNTSSTKQEGENNEEK